MTNEQIKLKIQSNRNEINELMIKDWPLDLIYLRVTMLSEQNERLIKKMEKNK